MRLLGQKVEVGVAIVAAEAADATLEGACGAFAEPERQGRAHDEPEGATDSGA